MTETTQPTVTAKYVPIESASGGRPRWARCGQRGTSWTKRCWGRATQVLIIHCDRDGEKATVCCHDHGRHSSSFRWPQCGVCGQPATGSVDYLPDQPTTIRRLRK